MFFNRAGPRTRIVFMFESGARWVNNYHIVALLVLPDARGPRADSTMAQTGVSGPVVVDGESFSDALFASAGQG